MVALGMVDAFGRAADFSRMTTDSQVFISNVLHKALVVVDEAGTEAAAATVVLMKRGSVEEPPVVIAIDRPFLFMVRHRATGLILFMGRVADPSV